MVSGQVNVVSALIKAAPFCSRCKLFRDHSYPKCRQVLCAHTQRAHLQHSPTHKSSEHDRSWGVKDSKGQTSTTAALKQHLRDIMASAPLKSQQCGCLIKDHTTVSANTQHGQRKFHKASSLDEDYRKSMVVERGKSIFSMDQPPISF